MDNNYVLVFQLYDDVRIVCVCESLEIAQNELNIAFEKTERVYGKLKDGSWKDYFTIQEVPVARHPARSSTK